MSGNAIQDKNWYLGITNYDEGEYHRLSKGELREILDEEWEREFNGIFIGRDVDCVGRLGLFFYHDKAYVAYENFETEEWSCSYNLTACDGEDWDDLVRLTPQDAQDYSFRRCSIISKGHARRIAEYYVNTGEIKDLYLSDVDGKPVKRWEEDRGGGRL